MDIAIIPARGGSKRIPRKNVIDFNGKPMLAWTVLAAIDSGRFGRVLVSTDDPEIAEVAVAAGAEAPFLREQNADDFSPVSAATISALRTAEEYWGEKYSRVVQLMANCPLRTAGDVEASLDHFVRSESKFQISCFRYGWMNPWWAVRLSEAGEPERLFPEAATKRSQDLDPLYCPSGAIWIADRDSLLEAGTFYGPGHRFFPLSWQSALDIDDADDLDMALAIIRGREAV